MKKVIFLVAALGLLFFAEASFGGPIVASNGAGAIGAGSAPVLPSDGLLMDRGLPTTGVYAGGTNPDWTQRTNIGNGDYDPRDPAYGDSPAQLAGDTFTLPGSGNFYITDIRLWLDPNNGASSYSASFSAMNLMLGPVTPNPSFTPTYQPGGYWNGGSFPADGALPLLSSNLSLLSAQPTETDVVFPGTSYPLWQLDFPVNQTLTGGASYGFAIDPTGNPLPEGNSGSGNGESYFIAFLDNTMQGFSSGYGATPPALGNDSSDGFTEDFYTDGTLCDQYTSPYGQVMPFDVSVQVFGVPVPEPSSILLCVFAALGLVGYRTWRKR
jgi:hypothetical protein